MFIAVLGLSVINLLVFYGGYFKPVKNKLLIAFLLLLPISVFLSPKPIFIVLGENIYNFWVWKTIVFFIIFSLFIHSVYSLELSKEDIDRFLKVIFYCGFIMSCYMALQALKLDQFYYPLIKHEGEMPPAASIGGTLGHPTIVSPFVALCLPIALYFKKYLHAVLMGLMVLMTKSDIAIGAMAITLSFIYLDKRIFAGLLIALAIVFLFMYSKGKINDNGRFDNWKQIITDMRNPLVKTRPEKYSLTGMSPGSFFYTYHTRHNQKKEAFYQAHNEYLEVFYDMGLSGLVILLCGIFGIIKENINRTSRYRKYLLGSLVCVCICAGGTFTWHIAPIALFSCFIAGLLLKPEEEQNAQSIC